MAHGLVCLQGGAEFGAACRDMDAEVLARTPVGPVVVVPAAAEGPGAYAQAGRNASRWFGRLGADQVAVAPDPAEDPAAAADVIAQAALVALPGGSPSRLLDALTGPAGDAVRDVWAGGATLWGASAGAMVLCASTVLPDRGRRVVDGLGVVPGLALPHFAGEDRFGLELPAGTPRWGLPECGGVLLEHDTVRAVGAGEPVLLLDDTREVLPRGTGRMVPTD